jgi:hypothetical protein
MRVSRPLHLPPNGPQAQILGGRSDPAQDRFEELNNYSGLLARQGAWCCNDI